jgi:hypothetical protein
VKNPFAISYRSLRAFRVLLGSLVLVDLVLRSFDLQAHYTDHGILPRDVLLEHVLRDPLTFSVWNSNGSTPFAIVMFLLTAALSLEFIHGKYRPQLVSIALWLAYLSLHNRNPLVLNGGDNVLRMLLFWSIFLPTAPRETGQREFFGIASVALTVQMIGIYLSNGLTKTGEAWTTTRTAIRDAFQMDQSTTAVGHWLIQYNDLCEVLTRGTLLIEVFVPLLLLIPIFRDPLRYVIIGSFAVFHLGIALTMHLSGFSAVMIVGWVAFLPDSFWTFSRIPVKVHEAHRDRPKWQRVAETVLVTALIIMVIGGNARTVTGMKDKYPKWATRAESALGITQRWSMFAPYPMRSDRWPVVAATLSDNTRVNLWNEQEIDLGKPDSLPSYLKNRRWRSCTQALFRNQKKAVSDHVCEYFTSRWNESHDAQVVLVQLLRIEEKNLPDGNESAPEALLVWKRRYFMNEGLPES